ncbi:YdbH domain-containing protein [Marilutibacter chinensis]|uniref:YdbH domain-containing protein n=1 Tax=Marilutibacter chinensis TaxID=2912247 RepID=A0ABS9HZD7_9GAMM|nr:YdbH domain-containing protein [Lysobacter chinensis]MCF7223504.1 YdbH domain-containing protein [Lysobacter chinensis]
MSTTVLLVLCMAGEASARALVLRAERVDTAVATLDGVRVRLEWPAGDMNGTLEVHARRVVAPELGYRFEAVTWRCTLQRDGDGDGGWRCDGNVDSRGRAPMRLALALGTARTDAVLSRGRAQLALHRDAGSPDITRIDLRHVPVAWAQALVSQAWAEGRFGDGRIDAELQAGAPADRPLRVSGPIRLDGLSLDTADGRIAAEGVRAMLELDSRFGALPSLAVHGRLEGGELLFGTTYVSLGQRRVDLALDAERDAGGGWRLPQWQWQDGAVLDARGQARIDADATLRDLQVDFRSADLGRLGDAYLSGWFGMAGLAELQLAGQAEGEVSISDGELATAAIELTGDGAKGAAIDDPRGRFTFTGLRGDVRYAAHGPVSSELRWEGGELYGLRFGASRLPFLSHDGVLEMPTAAVPMLGGELRFERLRIRPPAAGQGLDVRFGLGLDDLDIGQLSTSLGWPAFTGALSGRIPMAHYAADRLDFDGGLDMQLFEGRVAVSALSMERPFGVAPTLSADVALEGLDLEALTGVFGFGSITGRLHGRIGGLRLVNWQPVAFEAELHTERTRGVRQRISQRAVQDLSSVGDASFVTSLQGQLIGLFDDFGYSRIGIACTLADEVCEMDGLRSVGRGFIVVEGAGIPRLTVVGYNRRVHWPTLVERLGAVGSGDVAPVVE